jgi:hypothetical protein
MKDKAKQRLDGFKSAHKSGKKGASSFETGIPNTDVLGMQKTNQGEIDETSSRKNKGHKG